MIFDTHAHYDDEKFDEDRDEVLLNLKENNVGTVVNVGASFKGAVDSFDLSHKYDFIYSAVGIHPDHAKDLDDAQFEKIRAMAKDEKCVAVGEIGLDYYWDASDREVQKAAFIKQLKLASELNKPVIIHSRDAAEDTMEILKKYADVIEKGAVIHCFSYSSEIAKEYVKMGFYIGVGGVVTFKNGKKLKETVVNTPLERILTETDCPYLAPEPNRGKRNDSTNIKYVVEEIARLKGVSAEEVIRVTEENARRFYGLSC